MTTTTSPTIVRRNHWVSLGTNNDKEQITTTFATEWRGQEVCVEVSSSRYLAGMRGELQMTPWHHYVSGGWYGNQDEKWSAKDISETARARLSDSVKSIAEAWIDTDGYRESWEASAFGDLRSQVARVDSIYAADRIETTIHQSNISDDAKVLLFGVIDSYRQFQQALADLDSTN